MPGFYYNRSFNLRSNIAHVRQYNDHAFITAFTIVGIRIITVVSLTAREICFEDGIPENLGRYISDLALGYLAICDTQKPEMRELTEFYGLRDFYRYVCSVLFIFLVPSSVLLMNL